MRHWYLDQVPAAERKVTLPELFTAGVECGYREAREELLRRIAVAEIELEAFRDIRDHAQLDREALAAQLLTSLREQIAAQLHIGSVETLLTATQTEVAATRARIIELESSTMWRATAPLRRGGHRVKIALARFRASIDALRQSPRYVGVALAILRNEGPLALTRRVARRLTRPRRFVAPGVQNFVQANVIAPLAFEVRSNPRVSIIIPMHGKPLVTYTCLAGLHASAVAAGYEIIVLDDASPERAEDELAAVTGVRFVRNDVNAGFVGSCNRAAEEARGEILVFLNNDTLPTAGWLDACLLAIFDAHPRGRLGRRQADLSRRPPAGGGRHRMARWLGMELRP